MAVKRIERHLIFKASATIVVLLVFLSQASSTWAEVDCPTVTALLSACSSFITYGTPDPTPGSPCCVAITSLNTLAESIENRRSVCRCFMGLIATYNPNATPIATLPGFCGIFLGFNINPNTDCNYIL